MKYEKGRNSEAVNECRKRSKETGHENWRENNGDVYKGIRYRK
jgi:hypothetical protein